MSCIWSDMRTAEANPHHGPVATAPQRRGRRIAMTPEECNAFLSTERTCRVGTVGANGLPHVSPLWFVWDGRTSAPPPATPGRCGRAAGAPG